MLARVSLLAVTAKPLLYAVQNWSIRNVNNLQAKDVLSPPVELLYGAIPAPNTCSKQSKALPNEHEEFALVQRVALIGGPPPKPQKANFQAANQPYEFTPPGAERTL